MRDAEILYLILAAIYLAECVKWLRHDAVVFRASGLGWQPGYPGATFGNLHGGFALASPWPWAGRFIVSEPWPCSVSPEGVYFHVSTGTNRTGRAGQSGMCLPWSAVVDVTDAGKEIRVAGHFAARAASVEEAESMARRLSAWAALLEAERAGAIMSALVAAGDRKAARERFAQFTTEIARLRRWTGLLAILMFGGGALLVWTEYWRHWPWILGALVITHLIVLRQFAVVHRALYPTARGDRYLHLGMMLISPPAGIRSPDALSTHVLAGFHPLTVATVLLDERSLARYAGAVVRDMHWPRLPICTSDREGRASIESWFRAAQTSVLHAVVTDAGLDVGQLLAPPPPETDASRSYCPRCLSQFVLGAGHCAACGGVELRPLASEPVATS